MATFTINEENNITVFASAEEAAQAGDSTAISFDSQAGLAKVSAEWPLGRFVEIWNSIPGNREVSKFADCKKAVVRIWTAIQSLAGNAQPAGSERGETKKAGKNAGPAKKSKATKKAAPAKKASVRDSERSNKKAEVIAMMEAGEGRDARRDHGGDGLAGTYRAWLREHPRQQGRTQDRIIEERRWGANLPNRKIASQLRNPDAPRRWDAASSWSESTFCHWPKKASIWHRRVSPQ